MPIDQQLHDEIMHLHAEICAGLADSTRILILYSLAEQPRSVNEIVKMLNLNQPTVSRHLQVLRSRKLVSAAREAHNVIYSLSDHRVIEALDLLRAVMSSQLTRQADLAEKVDLTQITGGKIE